VDAIVGGVIPRQYIPAVEKGIVEASHKGILAGFPCVDFKVTLNDGSFHVVDSSEMAFKIAASMCFKKGVKETKPTLLEPIVNLTVTVREEYMGDVIGDLNSRRGKGLGMEAKGKNQIIRANVPMAEILNYIPDLTSMTGGRGSFTTEFDHYAEVPAHIVQKIVDETNKE
jgi:elongation factor G